MALFMLHNKHIKTMIFNFIVALVFLSGATAYASHYIVSKDGLNIAKDSIDYDVVNTVADAGIKTAVNGDSFTDNLKNSAIDTISQNAAGAIGANKESLGQLGQKLAHAGLGCSIASASGGDCASGAFGAVVGEMLAEGIGQSDLDDDTVLMLSQIGVIALASASDLNVEDAEKTGTNAVKYNYLSTRQKEKFAKELKECQGVMACGLTVAEKYGVSISQDAVLGTGIVAGLGEGLYDEAKELVEVLSDPTQAVEGLKALLNDPSLIKGIAQAELDEVKQLLTDFETNYEIAGVSGAFDAGENLGRIAGKVIALVGGAATGVGVAVGTSKVVGKLKAISSISKLPGPRLDIKTASTFHKGLYTNRKLTIDTKFYKYHGVDNKTGKKTSWVTNKKYASEDKLRRDLAIREDWGVKIDKVSEFNIPKGSWVSEGKAAAKGKGYSGGGYQAVVQNLPKSQIIRTDRAFK